MCSWSLLETDWVGYFILIIMQTEYSWRLEQAITRLGHRDIPLCLARCPCQSSVTWSIIHAHHGEMCLCFSARSFAVLHAVFLAINGKQYNNQLYSSKNSITIIKTRVSNYGCAKDWGAEHADLITLTNDFTTNIWSCMFLSSIFHLLTFEDLWSRVFRSSIFSADFSDLAAPTQDLSLRPPAVSSHPFSTFHPIPLLCIPVPFGCEASKTMTKTLVAYGEPRHCTFKFWPKMFCHSFAAFRKACAPPATERDGRWTISDYCAFLLLLFRSSSFRQPKQYSHSFSFRVIVQRKGLCNSWCTG